MSLTESTSFFSFLLPQFSVEFSNLKEAILSSLLRLQFEFLEVRLPILELPQSFSPLLVMQTSLVLLID